jgi:hypothetical protein
MDPIMEIGHIGWTEKRLICHSQRPNQILVDTMKYLKWPSLNAN